MLALSQPVLLRLLLFFALEVLGEDALQGAEVFLRERNFIVVLCVVLLQPALDRLFGPPAIWIFLLAAQWLNQPLLLQPHVVLTLIARRRLR